MRVQSVVNLNNANRVKNSQTKFESKNSALNCSNPVKHRKYSGVASADLAYASMFDSAIAKDLKLMGLI